MPPRITVLTRAIDDLARSVAFDRDRQGLAPSSIVGTVPGLDPLV